MAVLITKATQKDLMEQIKAKIKKGEIDTWAVHPFKGKDYLTHSTKEGDLAQQGYFLFEGINVNGVGTFAFYGSGERPVPRRIYGLYHGRFIGMLMTHFHTAGEWFHASPDKHVEDVCTIE